MTDSGIIGPAGDQERVEAMWSPFERIIIVRNTASGDEVKFGEEAWWAFLDSHGPALDDSDRPHVEEARRVLAAFGAGRLSVPASYCGGWDRVLHGCGRTLPGLLDKIAPKGTADA